MTLRLTLVARAYCHLCDDLRGGVLRLIAGRDAVLEEVDVDASEALEARFGEQVPVLLLGPVATGREICHHFLDERRLLAILADSAEAQPGAGTPGRGTPGAGTPGRGTPGAETPRR